MAPRAPPRKRAAKPPKPSPARAAVVPGSIPEHSVHPIPATDLPHVHAVCRRCGRIADVELNSDELGALQAFAHQRPVDWTVEGITFSITGTCPRCRASGPA